MALIIAIFIILLAVYLFSITICYIILEAYNYIDCGKWIVSLTPIINTIYSVYLVYSLVTKENIKEFIENLKV